MVSPFILVHPSEEYVNYLHQHLLRQGELLTYFFVPLVHIIYDVYDLVRLLINPESLPVLFLHEVAQFVQETVDYFFLLVF